MSLHCAITPATMICNSINVVGAWDLLVRVSYSRTTAASRVLTRFPSDIPSLLANLRSLYNPRVPYYRYHTFDTFFSFYLIVTLYRSTDAPICTFFRTFLIFIRIVKQTLYFNPFTLCGTTLW